MHQSMRMRQYQQQAVTASSPEQIVAKIYDIAIASCYAADRSKLRKCLVELISGLDFERGGEIAQRLLALYEYCLRESIDGDLAVISELLSGLREAWRDGVLERQAA